MSTFDLSGRSALVTGGARGLGAGIAAALTGAGARVMIGDVLKVVGEQSAAELPAAASSSSTSPATPRGRQRSRAR